MKTSTPTSSNSSLHHLDIKAQSRNSTENRAETQSRDVVEVLRKRARRKHFSTPIHTELVKLKNERERYYRNAIHCASVIEQQPSGRLITHYCNSRLCSVCQAIRTAKAIERYDERIHELHDPHLLTLTRKTVPGTHLSSAITAMGTEFGLMNDLQRKRSPLHGLRKLEVTWNPITEEFHPHYHVLLDGSDVAESLLEQWLKRHRRTAVRAGQHIQAISKEDDSASRIIFGYVTKLVTRVEENNHPIPPEALDTIIASLFGKRTLQPYGKLRVKNIDPDTVTPNDTALLISSSSSHVGDRILWDWEQDLATWINRDTDELLFDPEDVPVITTHTLLENQSEGRR